jgi:hypothetical protein
MMFSKKNRGRTKDATPFLVLTRNTIIQMAEPVYFGRGEEYIDSRLMGGLLEFDGRITFRIRGTSKYEADNPPPLGDQRKGVSAEKVIYR